MDDFHEKCKALMILYGNELPEEYSYSSLPLCIIDAVFSIGINYSTVKNIINRYCSEFHIDKDINTCKNEQTISNFIKIFDKCTFKDFANKLKCHQKTSTKKGAGLKIKACYEVAQKFNNAGIDTLSDFRAFMNNPDKAEKMQELENEILKVEGQSSGIMLKYLYMLAGDDDLCKPDRHLRSFFGTENDEEIQRALEKECASLARAGFVGVTVRILDHNIWQFQRSLK